MKTEKIVSSAEAWESGELGRSVEHAVVAPPGMAQQIDDALGMQMISIRLPKDLIDEFKMIAQVHNLGYQPLMRDALKRFAEAELKKLAILYVNEKTAKEQAKAKSDPCAEAVSAPARAASASARAPKRSKPPEKLTA